MTTRTELASFLAQAVEDFRSQGKSTVWVRAGAQTTTPSTAPSSSPSTSVDPGDAISAALAAGFTFHHAKGGSALLFRWLRDGTPCKVPPYAGTQVGVAGVVIDDHERLLLVRERSGGKDGKPGPLKFPGGLADIGEGFGQTAEREVWEETGVRAGFRSLLSFRHQHGLTFGVSDLYVLCLLRPLARGGAGGSVEAAAASGAPPPPLPLCPDPEEIAEAQWMDATAYAAAADHPINRHVARLALHELRREREGGGAAGAHSPQADLQARTSAAIAEEDVYIPVTRKWTKVYRAAAGRPIEPAAGAPAFPTTTTTTKEAAR
jgi:8-oxo-dGTP pyrophosphatase MutT (NUDIX family)